MILFMYLSLALLNILDLIPFLKNKVIFYFIGILPFGELGLAIFELASALSFGIVKIFQQLRQRWIEYTRSVLVF